MEQHFILIGTPKSGSSSLYKFLNDHPQTALSKVKEYNFFMDMGYDWNKQDKTIRLKKRMAFSLGYLLPFVKKRIIKHYYKSCYKVNNKVSGDGSICYFYFPEVPKRIKFYVPESKLILMLRNPIDRLFSNYWMHYKAQKKRLDWDWKWESFEHFIEEGGHIKEINHYSVSFKRWLKYFTLNDILIITSEDFYSKPHEILKIIENYLGLKNYDYKKEYWISPHSTRGNEYPEMKAKTRKYLTDYFKPYIKELEFLSNKRFNWVEFD